MEVAKGAVPNEIIYINGPSSAGKTTLARVLQDLLPQPYLYVSIDTLIELMPPKTNDWSGERSAVGYSFQKTCDESGQETFRVVAGPYGQKIAPAFRAMVLALARSGLKLIIDDIAFGSAQVQHWRETLRDFAVLWVGVTADAETLAAREAARGDRLVGSARDQLVRVHTGVTYDLMLDTTALTSTEVAARIIARLSGPNSPSIEPPPLAHMRNPLEILR